MVVGLHLPETVVVVGLPGEVKVMVVGLHLPETVMVVALPGDV